MVEDQLGNAMADTSTVLNEDSVKDPDEDENVSTDNGDTSAEEDSSSTDSADESSGDSDSASE